MHTSTTATSAPADLLAFLRTPAGRDAYRHELARDVGATADQISALRKLDEDHELHHPVYKPLVNQCILAVYSSVRHGSASFVIGSDGNVAPAVEASVEAA